MKATPTTASNIYYIFVFVSLRWTTADPIFLVVFSVFTEKNKATQEYFIENNLRQMSRIEYENFIFSECINSQIEFILAFYAKFDTKVATSTKTISNNARWAKIGFKLCYFWPKWVIIKRNRFRWFLSIDKRTPNKQNSSNQSSR